MTPEVLSKFEARVERIPFSTCWHWIGAVNHDGYGQLTLSGWRDPHRKMTVAHRLSYEHFVGPLAPGLELDHLCRNPGCVNPAHLEQVTHRENVRRGNAGRFHAEKTHCPKGHLYDEENTAFGKNGGRRCSECNRISSLASYHRKRAGASHLHG